MSQSVLHSGEKTHNYQVKNAYLFLGKAAIAQYRQIFDGKKMFMPKSVMVIAPDVRPRDLNPTIRFCRAEHPLPGEGSFRAAREFCEWIVELRDLRVQKLRVFLSGGGSSLFWLEPAHLKREEVLLRTSCLYRQSLTIDQLNQKRAVLCGMKDGGAARLIQTLFPELGVSVLVTSDVAPFGPEVVSSGPFTGFPHRVIASNGLLVKSVMKEFSVREKATVDRWPFQNGSAESVAKKVSEWIRSNEGKKRILIFGAEPQVKLPAQTRPGRGGRMSHLAGLVLSQARTDSFDLLCSATDGSDGASHSSGVDWSARSLPHADRVSLGQSLKSFDSATWFDRRGALIPAQPSRTNLQDVVIARTWTARS